MLIFQKLDKTVHNRKAFQCGVFALDNYLKRYAMQNQTNGLSVTYVLVESEEPSFVLGYVSLSTAHLEFGELSPQDIRHLPRYPVPSILIDRLAVSLENQGKGYGATLLGFAVHQAQMVRGTVGVRLLIVDAKDPDAAKFYKNFGFTETLSNPLLLYSNI